MNVAVFGMGQDGISVGPSGSNANFWRLSNVVTKNNTRHGVYIDSPIGEANGGVAVAIESSLNTGAGVRIGRGDFNTFIGLLVENNGANGIHLEATADRNTFVGGDFDEGNTGFDVYLAPGGTDNAFFGTSPTVTTISDNATRTKVFAANYNKLDTLRLTTDNGFKLVGQTSAGSTFAGTLSNAPHAGNPTFWLRVQINGSNCFMPCW